MTNIENEAFNILDCHNIMRRQWKLIRCLIDPIHYTISACSSNLLRIHFSLQFDCTFSSMVTGTNRRPCRISSAFSLTCTSHLFFLTFSSVVCSRSKLNFHVEQRAFSKRNSWSDRTGFVRLKYSLLPVKNWTDSHGNVLLR